MKISKKDALEWFEYLSSLSGDKTEVYKRFSPVIESTIRQIELSVNKKHEDMKNEISDLKTLKGRTYFVGDQQNFPKGCVSCLFGDGLGGIRKTHKCNLLCKFCYYHDNIDNQESIPDGMWEIGETLFYEDDIDLLLSIQKKPSGIAYVYLEPFLEIEKYYGIIKKLSDAGIYQHMYTNGSLCTRENLKKLGEAGLNELRFNLGAVKCSDQVIEYMAMAKEYIPMVGIETPMTPEFYEAFQEKKDKILKTGIDFMNCAELHFGEDNINNYVGERMYVARRGYISPLWSREITLKLMKQACDENWGMVVHDCSNHTKYSRELNKNSKQGQPFGATTYVSEFDRFLPHLFLATLEDENFKFIEEEELPEELKLENCQEEIEFLVVEEEDEMYDGFFDDEDEEDNE
ncbi:radical SAM protein [Cetobacterium sp. 8H]|uniref:radical SAM protein n=1 Tax=Cetobacterium sp. 8H TaxID=2759681 RepID=UPI00163CDFC0|nr:radical SAM protein [Cetobacterium sp. 8H]MBC2851893.1 radical SAM protein [Cetobacterium sp. 8H]